MQKQRGVTLIALIITIIILLILAGISVIALFGETGLITRSRQSQDAQRMAEILDRAEIVKSDLAVRSQQEASIVYDKPNLLLALKMEFTGSDIKNNTKIINIEGKYELTVHDDLSFSISIGGIEDNDNKEEGKLSFDYELNTQEQNVSSVLIYITPVVEETYAQELLRVKLAAMFNEIFDTFEDTVLYIYNLLNSTNYTNYEEFVLEYNTKNGTQYSENELNNLIILQAFGEKSIDIVAFDILKPGEKDYNYTMKVTNPIGETITLTNKKDYEYVAAATMNGEYTFYFSAGDLDENLNNPIKIHVNNIQEEKFSAIYSSNMLYTDSTGKTAMIPAGFAVGITENINKINNGLVITDAVAGNGSSLGNEYVWIPVNNMEEFTRTTASDTNYSEPSKAVVESTDLTGEYAEYNAIYNSIQTYKGFYIGRYEGGLNGDHYNSKVIVNEQGDFVRFATPIIRKGVPVYNHVIWGTGAHTIESTHGNYVTAVEVARDVAISNGYTSATTTLCYGAQWDRVMSWAAISGTAKQFNDMRLLLSGVNEEDVQNNIYDLTGSVSERTMETYYNAYRIIRGGNFQEANSASYRNQYSNSTDVAQYNGFRVALYIH